MSKYPLPLLFFSIILISGNILAAPDKTTQLRLDRIERMLENNSQYQLLSKIKQLKEENRELRGLVEEQSNLIKKLERRIHSLYSDMDRRMVSVETDTAKILSGKMLITNTEESTASSSTATMPNTETGNQPVNPTANQTVQSSQPKQAEAPQNTANITPETEDQNSKLLAEKQYAEQKAYQKAFEQLKALRYSKAQQSFSIFLKQYPDGRYAHIAQYWLAESSYAQRKFKQAINDYQTLLSKYKKSPKRAEAYLKIAYCHYELGDKKKTRDTLNLLIKRYPGTTESGQAKRLLKRL